MRKLNFKSCEDCRVISHLNFSDGYIKGHFFQGKKAKMIQYVTKTKIREEDVWFIYSLFVHICSISPTILCPLWSFLWPFRAGLTSILGSSGLNYLITSKLATNQQTTAVEGDNVLIWSQSNDVTWVIFLQNEDFYFLYFHYMLLMMLLNMDVNGILNAVILQFSLVVLVQLH